MAKDFNYYFAQLRKTEAHREKGAEKEIRKLYKELLSDTKAFIADEYYKYAEDGKLTYEILRSHTADARFLSEVEKRLNEISPQVSKEITGAVREMYTLAYNGMVEAVQKANNAEELANALKGIKGVTPEAVKAHVNNPIAGLTLKDTLERNRKNIIWDIKREIGVGLTNGDSYSTMARRIAESLDGDYKKAVTIVRTEASRAREAGHLESSKEINDTLKTGSTKMRMTKTWKTVKDGRVRDQHAMMDGITVGMDEMFELPDGHETEAPHLSGIAGQDINCRCFVKYDLMDDKEFHKATGKHLDYYEDVGDIENNEDIKVFVPKSLEHISEHVEVYDSNVKVRLDKYKDGLYDDTCSVLQDVVEQNDFYMRRSAKTIDKIFDGDGRFKNQFETGASSGSFAPDKRKRAAQNMFGADVDNMDASDFEKYGFLASKDVEEVFDSEVADWYGDILIKFKKDDLFDRTTMTVGDSLQGARFGKVVASPVSKPTPSCIPDVYGDEIEDISEALVKANKRDVKHAEDLAYSVDAENGYIELQFHGELTADNIETIACGSKYATPERVAKWKDKGINVVIFG